MYRNQLKWADGKAIKSEIDMQLLDLLGPKTEEDLAPVKKAEKPGINVLLTWNNSILNTIFYIIVWAREVPVLFFNNSRRLCTAVSAAKEEKKPAKEKVADTKEEGEEEGAATIAELMKNKVHFHAPGQNHTTDGYMVTDTTERLLREHLARTGGQVGSKFHIFIKTSYWYLLLVYQRRIKS